MRESGYSNKRISGLWLQFVLLILIFFLSGICVRAESVAADNYDQIVKIIKDQLANGDLSDEQSIRDGVESYIESEGLILDESTLNQIVDVLKTMNSLGLDNSMIADKVDKIYKDMGQNISDSVDEFIDQMKDKLMNQLSQQIDKAVKNSFEIFMDELKAYFKSFVDWIKDFFGGLSK